MRARSGGMSAAVHRLADRIRSLTPDMETT